MDLVDTRQQEKLMHGDHLSQQSHLPADLPTSLDDRRSPTALESGVEVYDAWQGQSQFITTAPISKPTDTSPDKFSYNLNHASPATEDKGAQLDRMLAAQVAYKDNAGCGNVSEIATDMHLSDTAKTDALQRVLAVAASNGDVDKLQQLLAGPARPYVDLDAPDEEGTAPLIYASCFGHDEVVTALLSAGADVDKQDHHQWTALMWATTNRHRNIVKILLDHGASPDVRSSSGRTAFDFVAPNSDISDYLNENGYNIGSVGVADDFYSSGFSQDRFEEELAENELKRRIMMESSLLLEVDLGNLGLDEQPESPFEPEEDENEFVWDKCLNDQMFVFQENELGRILDIIITDMQPQRRPSQKPVPANVLFLSARYAHYHANHDLLEMLLHEALLRINDVVERDQWDMTILAFWMSNVTLLLHYLKKDAGLAAVTSDFQLHIAELLNEIFVLVIRDAERRMDKVLDAAMLDHETIPGFEDVHFQNEWKLFRSKVKVNPPEPIGRRYKPPSPHRKAKTSPRNITSLLSSTLFVLDLYDIHSVITSQVIAQLLYWLGAELFNRIMSNRKYLARTKAMQVRMNISALEDWTRNNNRQAEHYENGSLTNSGQTIVEAGRHHLATVIQLLQWLQILSSLAENIKVLESTIQQLPLLSTQQLIHAAKYYRAEVGERTLPKGLMTYLFDMQNKATDLRAKRKSMSARSTSASTQQFSGSATEANGATAASSNAPDRQPNTVGMERDAPENLLLDSALMLPFSLPTSTDMLISYGAGLGGMNRERARKYIPTVPSEFIARLDAAAIENGQTSDDPP